MKVGILSMQKILNYGSFLQAYSLKKQFESKGHDVYFIDIEEGKQIVKNEFVKTGLVKKLLQGKIIKRLQNYFMFKRMSQIHVNDYEKYLQTEKKLPEGEKFDLVVIGSDEVFNCLTPSPWGFSPQLFGNIDNANKIITYAASCGQTDYEGIVKAGIEEELKDAMSNISAFSVRDENTKHFVKNITDRDSFLHLDPVFLYDYDKEIEPINFKKPYLLIYAYSNRITDKQEIKKIKQYAKERGLQIVCVGQQQRWCKHNICANGFQLLSYFINADCVITDTFHGAVLSIKYNKKLGVLVRESNKNKLEGLLNYFGLINRVLICGDYSSIMEQALDYTAVNDLILDARKKANDYFNKALEGID